MITAPSAIADLVSRFDRNRDSYRSASYNEEQLRAEFLNPLFIALGWDVYNASGFAEPYKDVVFEQSLKIGGGTKAPDYCFRIGNTRKFFLEAKKPAINLKDDPAPAYQLRRYAWSAKLPLSILSDFEEFAVYDCRLKPDPADKASAGRILYLTYDAYLDRWSDIADVFSKDAVLKGSFDKFAETSKKKKGTAEVDSAFLKEIESWRETLAKNIALRFGPSSASRDRNPRLTNRELNFAVQATIDRIIFLRICGDRGIEDYTRLQQLQNGANIYQRLFQLFDEADDKYNSGLFYFKKEKDRGEPDTLTPQLDIDDKILKDIIKSLYYPDSPYEFSVLPADILGQVYEQFLGKVIRLTPSHQAKVEAKPEVKKAGGVYYTPTYIVDYIVKNTVGKLLEGKTPEDVAATALRSRKVSGKKFGLSRVRSPAPPMSNSTTLGARLTPGAKPLRILDPACGSGSFLLGAYQYLLDWYLDQYIAQMDPDRRGMARHAPTNASANTPGFSGAVTSGFRGAPDSRRAHINLPIYQTSTQSWKLTTSERKRILLDHIFGVDIDQQAVEVTKLSLLLKCLEGETEASLHQLKLFYKQRALPDLSANVKCGNSLIGSDFYRNQQMTMFDQEEILRINAFDWDKEFPDVFNHKDTKSTKEEAGFDVVIGNPPYGAFFSSDEVDYYRKSYLSASGSSDSFALFMEKASDLLKVKGIMGMIVQSAWVSAPSFDKLRKLFVSRFKPLTFATMPYDVFGAYIDTVVLTCERLSKGETLASFKVSPVELVVFPIRFKVRSINDFATFIKQANAIRWLEKKNAEFLITLSEEELAIINKIEKVGKPFHEFADIQRGVTPFNTSSQKLEMNSRPAFTGIIRRYILQDSKRAFIRYDESLAEFKPERYFLGPRLLLRELISRQFRLQAVFSDKHYITNKSMQSILITNSDYNLYYFLGILNSRLLSWYFLSIHSVGRRDDFPKIVLKQTRELPLRWIDFNNSKEKALHNRMAGLVETMLDLHKRKAAAKVPSEREALERQIAATDAEIDGLVYELYGLTEKEIKIVEI